MTNLPLLSLMIFMPLLGAFALLLLRGSEDIVAQRSRWVAMGFSLLTFVLSLAVLAYFRSDVNDFQLSEKWALIPPLHINYMLGVDAISVSLILLTTFLMPIALLASRKVTERVREYMVAFMVLETMILGTFCAIDMFLFYVFFEGVLLPMFIIIGVWGGKRRIYASYKFFLYTLLGSVLMLLAMIVMYQQTGTTDMVKLARLQAFTPELQKWLFLAFLASFAVKLPMWPVHTWLPDAHVEAPTAGSIILAGVLLKMGGYGFIRFSLPMFPEASAYFAPMMWGLSLIAIIYTSLVALVQEDMKKMIAYSSVAHMGYVTLGLFSFSVMGLQAAMFQMISHGVVSAALFFCVGVLYDRMHTRQIASYGGVVNVMPKFAVFFMFMVLASVGLPGTSGFVGEFLSLMAIFRASISTLPDAIYAAPFAWSQSVAVIATSGVVLGAAYMLWLYRKVMFGEVANEEVAKLKDINWAEWLSLLLMGGVVLWLGLHSAALLDFLNHSVSKALSIICNRPLCEVLTLPVHR